MQELLEKIVKIKREGIDSIEEVIELENKYNLTDAILYQIMQKADMKLRLKLLIKYKDKLNPSNIVSLMEAYDVEQQIEILEICNRNLIEILKRIEPNRRFEMLKLCNEKFELEGKQIRQIILQLDDSEKIQAIELYKDKLDNSSLGEILFGFDKHSEEIEKYIEEFIENAGFGKANGELSKKIFEKLGDSPFAYSENANLLTDKSIELFGEKDVYYLFKYFIYNKEILDVENILKNAESFRKYQEFRKNLKEEKQVPGMDTRDTILEYNDNFELINDCMKNELNSEEESLFKAAIKEQIVQITSKEELEEFPCKRKEEMAKLIEINSQEALIYLLTGMSKKEYEAKVKECINDMQIDNILENFGDESEKYGIIKVVNEMINLVSGMSEEDRKKVLSVWNEDLGKEFTQKGSHIASARDSFEDIEIAIRKLYGRELHNSLTEKHLPEAVPCEEDPDISVIHLKGEEFKLIVHALNAFNKGHNEFNKSEIGKPYICMSLISDKHIGVAVDAQYYGFRDIGDNALVFEGHEDIYSYDKGENSTELNTSLAGKFDTAEHLIEETEKYNEVVLWREYVDENGEYRDTTPEYIVSFNKISSTDRKEARRLGLPIINIHCEKYMDKPSKKVVEDKKEIEVENPLKHKMIDMLKEASENCSAISEKEAMERIISYMERQLENNKEKVH